MYTMSSTTERFNFQVRSFAPVTAIFNNFGDLTSHGIAWTATNKSRLVSHWGAPPPSPLPHDSWRDSKNKSGLFLRRNTGLFTAVFLQHFQKVASKNEDVIQILTDYSKLGILIWNNTSLSLNTFRNCFRKMTPCLTITFLRVNDGPYGPQNVFWTNSGSFCTNINIKWMCFIWKSTQIDENQIKNLKVWLKNAWILINVIEIVHVHMLEWGWEADFLMTSSKELQLHDHHHKRFWSQTGKPI